MPDPTGQPPGRFESVADGAALPGRALAVTARVGGDADADRHRRRARRGLDPSRADHVLLAGQAARCRAMPTRTSSPAPWPRLSLTVLKCVENMVEAEACAVTVA